MQNYVYSTQMPNRKSVHSHKPPQKNSPLSSTYIHTLYRAKGDDYADVFIWSIGHQVTWAERALNRRVSTAAILHYVVDGQGFFNGQEVHAGQFFFTLPYQEYTIIQNAEHPMEYYWLSFAGIKTRDLLKKCQFDELRPVQDFTYMDQISQLFDEAIYQEHAESDMDLYLIGLCYRLLSFHKQMNLRYEHPENLNKDYSYFKQALAYINEHVSSGITVADVLQHLHISASYCRLIFHKYCQYSPQEMILFKRFELARSDLELTVYSVKEIALRAGYQDQSLFSRQFKKRFGMSPLEYRNHCNQIETLPLP